MWPLIWGRWGGAKVNQYPPDSSWANKNRGREKVVSSPEALREQGKNRQIWVALVA